MSVLATWRDFLGRTKGVQSVRRHSGTERLQRARGCLAGCGIGSAANVDVNLEERIKSFESLGNRPSRFACHNETHVATDTL